MSFAGNQKGRLLLRCLSGAVCAAAAGGPGCTGSSSAGGCGLARDRLCESANRIRFLSLWHSDSEMVLRTNRAHAPCSRSSAGLRPRRAGGRWRRCWRSSGWRRARSGSCWASSTSSGPGGLDTHGRASRLGGPWKEKPWEPVPSKEALPVSLRWEPGCTGPGGSKVDLQCWLTSKKIKGANCQRFSEGCWLWNRKASNTGIYSDRSNTVIPNAALWILVQVAAVLVFALPRNLTTVDFPGTRLF